MSSRMKKISTLMEAIENMKTIMLNTANNERMPFVIKTHKLEGMRLRLHETQMITLQLMQEELCEGDDHDN